MCNKGWKKAWMVRVQSARLQCTLCACSVFSALFGMFMTSVGVCLVLNYNIVEVDTSGLPPTLHNEEGKKVVGVILICVGLGALGLSGLVSALYFTACFSRAQDRPTATAASSSSSSASDQNSERSGKVKGRRGVVAPSGQAPSSSRRAHGGAAGPRPSTSSGGDTTPRAAGAGAGALPVNSRGGKRGQLGPGLTPETYGYFPGRVNTPPSMRSKSRHKAARHLPPRYQHRLAPHPEEEQSLHEAVSRASSAAMLKSHAVTEGHVNHAAEFDEDDNDTMMTARGDSCVSEHSSAGIQILVNEAHPSESMDDDSSSELLDSRSEVTLLTPRVESVVLTISEYVTGDRDQGAVNTAYSASEVGEVDDVASGGESRTSFSADSDLGSMSEEAKTSIP
ncbi:uncharacterized protein LOC112565774 isoform X2 [Pomacea canaliculata]|uniref:uncharacterized protein LOC112565774 isoform X2 n=1 Tax=Pomacea canaliculata TaxID=400727 RepID=UPI000D737491|nr:uncharacterized protein LOC112565774 isoform X2 [Pomacea canaliculata]